VNCFECAKTNDAVPAVGICHHCGAGLCFDHLAEARDFESIRASSRGAEALVDEMESAAVAGLPRAQALLAVEIARQVAPWDDEVATIAKGRDLDAVAVRRALLAAVRGRPVTSHG
jgi:hypothetical protein